MRHLFYVHSHLTAAVALAVIRHEGFDLSACAVVFDRGYRRSLPPRLLGEALPPLRLALKAPPWTLWRQIGAVDVLVRKLTADQPYHLYAPHLYLDATRVLFTNPRCQGISYLEEGLKAYFTDVPFNDGGWAYRVGRRWLTGGRVPSLPPFPLVHTHAYGLHATAFPTLPPATRVALPYPFDKVPRASLPESLDGAHILAFDALAEMGILRASTMEAGLTRLAEHLRTTNVRRLYYKLHPRQVQEPACSVAYLALLARLSPATELVRLPDGLVLEDVAGSFRDLTFYVAISSVGFYAQLAGQRVVSFARVLAQHEPAYAPTVEQFRAIYAPTVELT